MKQTICAAILFACSVTPALAARIDFEAFPVGSLGRTATIDGVSFESPVDLFVGEYFTETGTTRALCSRTLGTVGCESNLMISFANPVSQLSLLVDGANTASARILAFATLFDGSSRTLVFEGFQPLTPRALDFEALQNIRSVTFSTTDPQGFSYDDFSFSVSGVPEPSSWAMLILGYCIVGSALRRQRIAARATPIDRPSCAV